MGQLGKEKTLADAEDLISCYRVGFSQTDNAPRRGMCVIGANLLEYVQGQDSGPTETFSEAPRAYSGHIGTYTTQPVTYENTPTLAL